MVLYDYCTKTIHDTVKKDVSVIYIPGFQGSGHGLKSQALINHCRRRGYRYLCYDPEGIGESKVDDFSTLKFKHWFENAETAIKHVAEKNFLGPSQSQGRIFLVGSSMGGWISLRMANQWPNLISGMILIAPAVNFLRPKYLSWYQSAPADVKLAQDQGKSHVMDSTYGVVPVSKAFVDSSIEVEIDMNEPLQIQCPVKIIHGVQDDLVDYLQSIEVMNLISTKDCELIYQKSGDHRMQNESGLSLITKHLDDLILEN